MATMHRDLLIARYLVGKVEECDPTTLKQVATLVRRNGLIRCLWFLESKRQNEIRKLLVDWVCGPPIENHPERIYGRVDALTGSRRDLESQRKLKQATRATHELLRWAIPLSAALKSPEGGQPPNA